MDTLKQQNFVLTCLSSSSFAVRNKQVVKYTVKATRNPAAQQGMYLQVESHPDNESLSPPPDFIGFDFMVPHLIEPLETVIGREIANHLAKLALDMTTSKIEEVQ